MGASNQTNTGGKQFFKLKEDKVDGSPTKGELRFYKQSKVDGKWVNTESFNCLDGVVKEIKITEYEHEGEMKKQLVVVLQDVADTLEFSLGLRTNTANSILNTLAGDNGFDLKFSCGKPKESKGKYYPTLYINTPDGGKTQWKYSVAELPKVTTEVYKGNKIKVGQEEADAFWMEVVKFVQDKLGSKPTSAVQTNKESEPAPQGDDLPF